MEQKSREWYLARLGKITGSAFVRVLGSLRVRNTYIRQLIAERELMAGSKDNLDEYLDKTMGVRAPSLNWGNKYEDYAVSAFELEYNMDVVKSGFILHPNYDFIGVSVDGFVHDNDALPFAVAEVKCPYDQEVHKNTLMLGMPEKHIAQVQGNTWVTCMSMGYFISFDPRQTPDKRLYVQPVNRNPGYIDKLEPACIELYECVEAGKELQPAKSAPVLF